MLLLAWGAQPEQQHCSFHSTLAGVKARVGQFFANPLPLGREAALQRGLTVTSSAMTETKEAQELHRSM